MKAWLFGSFARGEETSDSDVDILVEYDKNARISLLTISHMMGELEKSTGRRIDLIEDGCLLPFAIESANRDKKLIYERREEVRDVERLNHMLEAINVLINYKNHHTLEDAKSDPVVYFGLVKHVEIIGEAVYKLTHEFRDNHPVLNWADIERMRHVLVHGYYKIRPAQLWETIVTDIPGIKPIIEQLILQEKSE